MYPNFHRSKVPFDATVWTLDWQWWLTLTSWDQFTWPFYALMTPTRIPLLPSLGSHLVDFQHHLSEHACRYERFASWFVAYPWHCYRLLILLWKTLNSPQAYFLKELMAIWADRKSTTDIAQINCSLVPELCPILEHNLHGTKKILIDLLLLDTKTHCFILEYAYAIRQLRQAGAITIYLLWCGSHL